MASWRFHRCFLENRPSSNPLQDDPRQSNIPDDDPCRKYPGQRIWRWNGKNYRRPQGNETRIWKTKTSISGFRILAGSRSRKNRAPDAAVDRSKHEFFSSRRRLTLSSFFNCSSRFINWVFFPWFFRFHSSGRPSSTTGSHSFGISFNSLLGSGVQNNPKTK